MAYLSCPHYNIFQVWLWP